LGRPAGKNEKIFEFLKKSKNSASSNLTQSIFLCDGRVVILNLNSGPKMSSSETSFSKPISYHQIGWLAFAFALIFSAPGFIQAFLVNGDFCYALDDSFIMMAISRNFAFHHVWGLTAHEFSSTASSPLFTVLLAGINLLIGDHIWIPLAVNVLGLAGLFLWLSARAKTWNMNRWQTWFLLMGAFYFMPVPVLLFGSMEHILHTWIALYCLQQVIEIPASLSFLKLILMGAILAGIRYEGLFEGGLLILWLWKNKEYQKGFFLGTGMLIPVCWLGFYSMAQGWFFLPNSLILKGYTMNIQETKDFYGYLLSWISKAANHPHAIVAMLVLYFLWSSPDSKPNENKTWLGIVLGISIVHFVLARYNHVYRYEAYLMALAWVAFWKTTCQTNVTVSFDSLRQILFASPVQSILYLALIISPLYRSVDSYVVGTRAMVNIYDQQVQMARFVKSYYNNETVGAIDIGAVAYYSDAKVLDLWGLADLDIAWLKLKNIYSAEGVARVCKQKNMTMAIGYGKHLDSPEWHRVERWVMPHNVVCSRDTIDFYAFTPKTREELRQNLILFHPRLPVTVRVLSYPNNSDLP